MYGGCVQNLSGYGSVGLCAVRGGRLRLRVVRILVSLDVLRGGEDFDNFARIVHPQVQSGGGSLRRCGSGSEMVQLCRFAGELDCLTALVHDRARNLGIPDDVGGKLLWIAAIKAGTQRQDTPSV